MRLVIEEFTPSNERPWEPIEFRASVEATTFVTPELFANPSTDTGLLRQAVANNLLRQIQAALDDVRMQEWRISQKP